MSPPSDLAAQFVSQWGHAATGVEGGTSTHNHNHYRYCSELC